MTPAADGRSHVELVGDRAQQAGDLLAGDLVGVAALFQGGVMFSRSVVRSCTMDASSSGLRRWAAATEGVGSKRVTERA